MNVSEFKKINGLILLLNLGSSGLKFSLVHHISLEKHWTGNITGLGTKDASMDVTSNAENERFEKTLVNFDLVASIKEIINWIEENSIRLKIIAIGYRVVQGGPFHICPELVTQKMLEDLESYIYLAPNHLPEEIMLMRQFRKSYIGIPHIACFDTYFHKDMPPVSKFYALPGKYKEMGLVRYGFHGISYESIIKQLLEEDVDINNQKIIIAHLGSGSSITAISNGISKDTTMGISPLGGLVMATRSGDLDPGAILFILKQDHLSAEQLDLVLSKESGLKAITGKIDMKQILANRYIDQKAAYAIDLFCYQAKKQIGSLAAAIGGLDLLIFCGGIGENSDFIRQEICSGLDFMGIKIDHPSNAKNDEIISQLNNKVTVRVMHTDEETMIAMHIQSILTIKNKFSYEYTKRREC